MKPRFDSDDYGVCMHCNTKEKAIIFLEYLDSKRLEWANGEKYSKDNTMWELFKENSVYFFKTGQVGDLPSTEDYNSIVLEYDDFDWSDFEE